METAAQNTSYKNYALMVKTISMAEGRPTLVDRVPDPEACRSWLRVCDTDQAIDIIELSARLISKTLGKQGKVEEINYRFRQNAIGFQFEGGQFIKVDDQFVHAEVVKPAIALLTSNSAYAAAVSEFMTAHQHYREGSNQDAVVAATARNPG